MTHLVADLALEVAAGGWWTSTVPGAKYKHTDLLTYRDTQTDSL